MVRPWTGRASPAAVVWAWLFLAAASPAAHAGDTVLGVEATRFTLNGKPTFLLGVSYYGALGAAEATIEADLDDLVRHGFNWLRVWTTWNHLGQDLAVTEPNGAPRPALLDKLARLVAACDRRGLIVDVTFSRGAAGLTDLPAHARAVTVVLETLRDHRNWYLDLGNERDVRDARYVSPSDLRHLRDLVHRRDPRRLVTASRGGHDLTQAEVRESLETIGLDFLSPHRPRHPGSPAETEARTRQVLAWTRALGHPAPVHHQEPFRRGYTRWQPAAEDFLADLRGAVAGGAAGWCFHNGSQRGAADQQPRRCFDLRAGRLFAQLDPEERRVVREAAGVVSGSGTGAADQP